MPLFFLVEMCTAFALLLGIATSIALLILKKHMFNTNRTKKKQKDAYLFWNICIVGITQVVYIITAQFLK